MCSVFSVFSLVFLRFFSTVGAQFGGSFYSLAENFIDDLVVLRLWRVQAQWTDDSAAMRRLERSHNNLQWHLILP